jgi:hypothetical protein
MHYNYYYIIFILTLSLFWHIVAYSFFCFWNSELLSKGHQHSWFYVYSG